MQFEELVKKWPKTSVHNKRSQVGNSRANGEIQGQGVCWLLSLSCLIVQGILRLV